MSDSKSYLLSDLLSVLPSEQGVFDRQYRLQRQFLDSISHFVSGK